DLAALKALLEQRCCRAGYPQTAQAKTVSTKTAKIRPIQVRTLRADSLSNPEFVPFSVALHQKAAICDRLNICLALGK
ncbi:hypothetical protein ACU4GD_40490, partial [Cupriavidus basilensis]